MRLPVEPRTGPAGITPLKHGGGRLNRIRRHGSAWGLVLAALVVVALAGCDHETRTPLRVGINPWFGVAPMHLAAADAQPANVLGNIWARVSGVYANAYGRFEPTDRVCGIGFRAFDASNRPVDVDPRQAARLFGTSSGVPPAAGIDIAAVDDDGATKLIFAPSEATGEPAFGLDQARCLRKLWTGEGERADRVLEGVRATALTGDLEGTPALVVHGRSDALVWVNNSSRPYYAANQAVEGERSNLRYLEITNAQHFDTLLGTPGFAARFVPMHVYFERALDRLHAHLTGDADLPPSQVIHTSPRGSEGGTTPPLAENHVPPIANTGHAEVIQWQDGILRIPR
jgi:hydroxybutyrate-dimer hydrolase